jgi:hypothetical protein
MQHDIPDVGMYVPDAVKRRTARIIGPPLLVAPLFHFAPSHDQIAPPLI